QATVAGAATALQTAQNNLAAAVLTAPTDGTIASLNGVVGQFISGGATSSSSSTSSSSAFITLSDLNTPQVSAAVSEADIGTVLVPNAAISNGKVNVLRNGQSVSVPVQTGISDGINTQIVSGINVGDQVVTGVSSATTGSRSGASSIFNFGGPAGGGANANTTGGNRSGGTTTTNQRGG